MEQVSYENLCISEVLEGLREGLSHFSPPSRAALIYAIGPEDPVFVFDPQELLRGHEPKLEELYLRSDGWRSEAPDVRNARFVETHRSDYTHPQLSGVISFGGWARKPFFQMWFTEHHPDMCSTAPTERWLEYAANLLSRNMGFKDWGDLGTSGYVLQEYATHAVRDCLVDERNILVGWDTQIRVFPVLDAVLGISRTLEEGAWPRGELVFVEPSAVKTMAFMARFPESERPSLKNFKHVRKLLLSVEDSPRKLVSDGWSIIGISAHVPPPASIRVNFLGGHGFLRLDDRLVCSFSDGRFQASTRKANLVQVEEALLETNLDPAVRHDLFRIVSQIVHCAGEGRHGCTVVIDLNDPPISIAGQKLEKPLDLMQAVLLELAGSLAKVDGALHIGADLRLHGFACLLDGHAVPGENRARGARFNSALRFSAEHPDLMVVVVSSDRPVSVIQGGIELTAQCEWRPITGCVATPFQLDDWIKG